LPRSCGFPLRSGERRCKQPRPQSSRRLRRSSRVLTSTVASLDEPPKRPRSRQLSWASCSLQHMPAKRVHRSRAAPPPAAFRLQGLATLLAACSPRRLVGPLSSRQRSWDSPYGAFSSRVVGCGFPQRRTRLPLRPRLTPARRSAPASIATPSYRALALPRSPVVRRRCLARDGLEAPLGFLPFQGCAADRLAEGLAPSTPLTRFTETPPKARTDRRLRVSLSDRLARLNAPSANQRGRARQPS
jgi:hypothetical protein